MTAGRQGQSRPHARHLTTALAHAHIPHTHSAHAVEFSWSMELSRRDEAAELREPVWSERG